MVPEISEIPAWVSNVNAHQYDGADIPLIQQATPELYPEKWKSFKLSDLFDLKKGKRLTKAEMKPGDVPFIGAIDNNNGLTAFVAQEALHPAGTLTVNYNGNGVADSFYQPVPFRCTDDVNVLHPKFEMTPAIALFIATVIRQEKYRFSYGRKWGLERMKVSIIKLPIAKGGVPDWNYMETYIKTLPFSAQI